MTAKEAPALRTSGLGGRGASIAKLLPITGRLRVRQDLLERVPAQTALLYGSPLTELAGQYLTPYISAEIHVGSHSCASLRLGV